MAALSKRLRLFSLLMALLFGFCASVQFNDPDWYMWIPLYASACLVNLINPTGSCRSRTMAKMTFVLGLYLLFKVVVEDQKRGVAWFCSLDMRERVVREKLGSSLVVGSMFLHLQASLAPNREFSRLLEYGKRFHSDLLKSHLFAWFMPLLMILMSKFRSGFISGMGILAGIGYGLSFLFLAFHKDEMKL